MSVVGFDIGYQSCYVAVARHGGVEVVANEYSDRRSPTMVAFGPKQRLMGISAKNQHVMNFKNTLYGFKVLLGRKFSDPFVQNEMKLLPFPIVQLENDGIGIKVSYGDGDQMFTPEQVTAMMLTYLKSVAEKALGKPVADCVVSVPSYFTDSQRRAFLDACTIAGLNCLRLLNETTAVALAYGIYKQDLPAETEKPRNVAFVDMGHSSLQVSICSFVKGKLKVLCKSCDPGVGGRDFDRQLLMYFAEEIKKKYKIDTMARPKQILRLLTECEKVKKVMSTVTNPQTLSIECFADDKDVSGKTSREEFNQMCSDYITRIRNTLEQAIADSGLSLADIDSVEVVGGSCRTPMVKDVITETFKRDISTTLNLDEAVARGCALQCAILSPSFKVRDFSIADTQPYPIKLKWQAAIEGEEGEMIVFKAGDPIYRSKILTFLRREPFSLEAVYAEPNNIPISDPRIGTFIIKGVTSTPEGELSKVKVKVRMSIHGTFFLKSATMIEKTQQEEVELPSVESMDTGNAEPQPEQQQADTPNGPEAEMAPPTDTAPNEGVEKMDTPEESTDQGADQAENSQGDQAGSNQGDQAGSSHGDQAGSSQEGSPSVEKKSEAESKAPEPKKAKKPTVRQVDLPIDSQTASLLKQQLDRANEVEVNMKYQDQLETERANAKNAVEEYVYHMRDQLDTSLREFITEADMDVFRGILTSTEDWLYEEGEDQPKKVYVAKLEELQKLGNPIQRRHEEFGSRQATFDELGSKIVHYEKIVAQYDTGDEVFDHIEGKEMDKVREQVTTKREWLNTNMTACHSLPKSSDPPVTCAQIKAELNLLETTCNPIVTKPKPKVEPPKEEPPKDDTAKEGEETPKEGEGEKMEEDPAPAGEESKTDDMDLD